MKKGVTLVELLVAIIISGIVIFITIQMFQGESQNYTKTRRKIKLQSDAREALRIVEEEVSNAGFRTSATINQGILISSNCKSYGYAAVNGTQPFISPSENAVEFRFYNPFPNNDFSCKDDLQSVKYTWDPAKKILSRKWAQSASADLSKEENVPFLENVREFSIQYGIYADNQTLLTSSQSVINTIQAPNLDAPIVDVASKSVKLTGWENQTYKVTFLVNIGVPIKDATYRIAFGASANDSFRDYARGVDTSTLRAGFFLADGTPTSMIFPFAPSRSSGGVTARLIQRDVTPTDADLSNEVYFGIAAKMRSPHASSANLTLDRISVKILNHGKINTWVDFNGKNTDPAGTEFPIGSTPDWSKVGAIRIKLTTQEKGNTTITHQREFLLQNNFLGT